MTSLRFSAILQLFLGVCLILFPVHHLSAQMPPQGQAPPVIQQIDVQFVGETTLSKQRVLDNLATKVGAPYNCLLYTSRCV